MSYKPKKRFHETAGISEVLDSFNKTYGLSEKLTSTEVILLWPQVMGDGVSSYTKNIWMKINTLFVELESTELKQELSYNKSRIIKMINEELGIDYVKDLKFV